jgi:glyoxylase-like metal-dependent hydrolase (beta-lactamase superfamily II)
VEEILPGVLHWTAFHERIRMEVHSHLHLPSRTLIDPMVPEEGLEAFEDDRRPERIVLSIRHHYRHSDRFREAFGCPVLCHETGLHEFEDGPDVEGFSFGEELAPGVVTREVDAISPDETAIHLTDVGAMLFADGVIRYGGELNFVPDNLMDEPEETKKNLKKSFRALLDLDFDALLFAHGEPLTSGGKEALRAFTLGTRD